MKIFLKQLLSPTIFKRFLFFFLFDSAIIVFSLYLSFLLRFDFTLPDEFRKMILPALPLFLVIKLSSFVFFRMYKITWGFVGLNDLQNIVVALIVSESLLMASILIPLPSFLESLPLPHIAGFPRSIFLIDGTISILLLSGLRLSKRMFSEIIKKRPKKPGKKTIIVGAGNTGEMILRDITRQGLSDFYPVGLLDDDQRKIGTYIHGIKVLGSTTELKNIVKKYNIEAMIIAIPSLNYTILRGLYETAREVKINTIKIVPRIYEFHKPDINLKNLEDIKIEDLIGRQVVNIDYEEISKFLKDKVVLVTGAGGSIGSEIIMQVCTFQPEKVILFDIDETDLYNLSIKLRRMFPHLIENMHFIVGDVKEQERVKEIFETFYPHIVFHAAAYKHVPMMEHNSKEAVKVNIFGTYTVAKASIQCGVEKFVMISTDKAVRPTSIMGATKRMAEHICTALNNPANTKFISVRFGNVLGSRGSVLPLFLEQLKNGGPLTITHKEMRRYFMTIPEAVSLVLQASVIGNGGEVLVLDMGEPVTIVALAEELIRIHGLEPYKDINIEFTGIRPGEKLFEETLTAEEGTIKSKHEKVFIAKNSMKYSIEEIELILKEFSGLIREKPLQYEETIKSLLKKYIKHYDGAKS